MKKYILYILLSLFITFPAYSQVVPSYHQGFATGSLSKRPNLWRGLISAQKYSLGITGIVTTRDVSGFKKHGTMNGSMTIDDWVLSGNSRNPGYHLQFDGADDYVVSSGAAPTMSSPWTLSGLASSNVATGAGSFLTIFGFFLSSDQRVGIGFSDNSFKINSGGETPGTGSGYVIGELNRLTMVYDGTDLFLYVNGIFDYSVTPTGSNWQAATNLIVGAHTDNFGFTNGLADSILAWNRKLLPPEIWDIHQYPNAMFEPRDMILAKPPAAAPARRFINISQFIDNISDMYRYN